MHQKTWLFLGVVVLLIGGGIYFLGVKKATAPGTTGLSEREVSGDIESQPVDEKQLGLLDFLTTKGAVRCSVSSKEGQKYTVNTDGKRVRIEGIMVPGKTPGEGMVPGMMINDGQYAYLWSGTQGMKFDMVQMMNRTPGQSSTPGSDPKDWKSWAESLQNSGVTYECGAAMVSDADFTPPAAVQFTDLSELMKQVPKDFKPPMPTNTKPTPSTSPYPYGQSSGSSVQY